MRSYHGDNGVAPGSLPDEARRQRWLPEHDELPGLKHGGIWSPEAVMRREARLGERVLVYDEGGNWRGLGTSWYLAEQGKQVVIVTPEPFIGREIVRTAADLNLRQRLARLGARWLTEHVIAEWHGNGATVRCLLTGVEQQVASDCLVLSTTNIAFDPLSAELDGIDVRLIGDAQAPRHAPFAFYEGRKVGLEI